MMTASHETRTSLSSFSRILIGLGIVAAATAAIVLLTIGAHDSWVTARQASCTSTRCFCESPNGRVFDQVVDSFSSLAFVLLGAWTLVWRPRSALKLRETPLVRAFGIVLIFIGGSSFFYHATLSFFGQFLDIFSMYLFGVLVAVGALVRCGRISMRTAIIVFIVANAVLAVVQYDYPDARRILFGALLVPGVVLELIPAINGHRESGGKVRFVYIGVAVLAVAYLFWTLDQDNILCDPYSWFQGHAVWHVLTAIASFMIVIHYRNTPHYVRKPSIRGW
jgi:hypothetical protein